MHKTEIGKELKMNVIRAKHNYLKLKKDPLEVFMRVFFQHIFFLNVVIFTFTMRSTFTFFTLQKRKNIKIWHLRNISFMVYTCIIIKT